MIRTRRTLKVLADPNVPLAIDADARSENDAYVLHALKTAGWAPFHYDRGEDGLVETLASARAVAIPVSQDCRAFAALDRRCIARKATGDVFPLVAQQSSSIGSPSFRQEPNPKAEQINTDDEHLAATAAMVQNFLLMLTARGMGSYWSSGGQMRSPDVFFPTGNSAEPKIACRRFR